jgi:dimethylargininase
VISHALVRPPGPSFARAISSSQAVIDVALAQAQHAEYCEALAEAGLTVESLPADERYPDGCFMQDPAMVIRGRAIINRPGAASRLGEEESLAEILAVRFPATRIVAPGTVEGGDVMVLPDRVLVGRSGRTNRAGIAQLVVALSDPPGLPVLEVPMTGYLHLLSAASYLGDDTILAAEDYADHPFFARMRVLRVPPAEVYAVNTLAIGDRVIVPAGYPQVAVLLRANGFTLLPVPVSEFAKADGGVTCLSLVW